MNEIITPPHLMAYDQDKFILKVKRIREDAMTTQAYIATMIGRDPGTFSKQMNKKFDFSLNDAAALHKVFDVSLDYLIADDERYGLYCSTDKTNLSRFDYMLGELLIEVDKVRGEEQDRRMGQIMMALANRHGVNK